MGMLKEGELRTVSLMLVLQQAMIALIYQLTLDTPEFASYPGQSVLVPTMHCYNAQQKLYVSRYHI